MGDNPNDNANEESPSRAGSQWRGDEVEHVGQSICGPVNRPPPPTVKKMGEMFLRLDFSQTMAMKLVDVKGIDSPWTLANISDEDIATVCDMICRPSRSVSRKTPNRRIQIFVLAMKNLKLVVFTFKTRERCTKDYKIRYVSIMSMLQYQHQWELEQKKIDNAVAPKLIRVTGRKL